MNIYNTVYRNYPGWFHEETDTVKKAKEVEEKKKPLIEPVKKQGDTPKTRTTEDSYDREGSEKRNEIRKSNLYDRSGNKVAI
ncbi:MAG: hypothetical protein MJ244_04580 [Clostridia bacterium]|nr:hypothetical protein [Clostridia bacterium]